MNKKYWWIIGIIIGLAIIGLAFWLGIYYQKAKPAKKSQTQAVANTDTGKESKKTEQVETTKTTEKVDSTEPKEDRPTNGSGWKIFKNLAHKYLIEYPDNATIINASGSESEQGKEANQAVCVEIKTKYTSVVITGRNISEEESMECLRTGFGSEWTNAPDEKVTASGVEYTATGMKSEAASAGYYNDSYSFKAVSGERFLYSISVNEKYDSVMTKAEAKEQVKKILASFSPAE